MDNEYDEELLIVRSQLGEKEAIEELLIRYHQLILKISKRYYLKSGESEDILQECRIAFYEAVMSYDAKRSGLPLESFAYVCVTRKMNSCVRRANSMKNNFFNDALMNNKLISREDSDQDFTERYSNVQSPEEIYIFEEKKAKYLEDISNNFPKTFSDIIDLRIQGYSYLEISELLGVTPKFIDNSLRKIKRELFFNDYDA